MCKAIARRLFYPKGSINRIDWWLAQAATISLYLSLERMSYKITRFSSESFILMGILCLIILYIHLSSTIRRLYDITYNFYMSLLVTSVYIILYIMAYAFKINSLIFINLSLITILCGFLPKKLSKIKNTEEYIVDCRHNKINTHEEIEKVILHDNDRYMITNEDWIWYKSLSSADIKCIYEQDDTYRMGAFAVEIKNGASTNEATKIVLKNYPYFYLDVNQRNELPNPPFQYKDDDMRLPFLVKKKSACFAFDNKYKYDYLNKMREEYSTIHAFYRKIFRIQNNKTTDELFSEFILKILYGFTPNDKNEIDDVKEITGLLYSGYEKCKHELYQGSELVKSFNNSQNEAIHGFIFALLVKLTQTAKLNNDHVLARKIKRFFDLMKNYQASKMAFELQYEPKKYSDKEEN